MKIGIDISQMVYSGTGVANFLENTLQALLKQDTHNEYILFGSSLRQRKKLMHITDRYKNNTQVKVSLFPFPPSILDILWNRLHMLPIELFIGQIDIFISSDWTQPPTKKAKKITILYDLIVYTYPEETATNIVHVQKRRLSWVKKECDKIICISQATKTDAEEILGIAAEKLAIVYPGI